MNDEADDVANRVAGLLGEFTAELVHKYGAPPQLVSKAAVGAGVMLFLEHINDDQRAAADWLGTFVEELREGAPPQPQAN